ncbi:hypothetical protein [Methylobacterium goesingense]|uniref:Transglycosylase SLT domain-containing protein n=1 Tax=Methylobacterium goesingense TaxID=243690 RepID=A0ABV2L1E2_9HYPH|nr:hypothetical protein [Methylobacterium goesingense]GJD76202.1 hypothetical protein CFIICLFH_4452 [Methylobacterium goesingense]
MPDARRDALIASAQRIGANPLDLATVISYETGGTFNPSIRGGAGNRHIGLIQFGAPEQQRYGAAQGQSFEEQLPAVEGYLTDRGFKPGMGILDLYSTINAGRPGRYNASDAGNGGAPGTVADKVNDQMGSHRAKAAAFLGGDFSPLMPGESMPSGRAPFSLSGPVGSSAPAPTIPDAPAKADSGPDLGAIMKMLGAGQGAAAPQAGAEAAPLPAPAPAPAPRPQAFDARKFFALLPSRR